MSYWWSVISTEAKRSGEISHRLENNKRCLDPFGFAANELQ